MGQPELAKAARFSDRTIYSWEAGERNVTYVNACRLARALNVHVSVLWDHTPVPDATQPAPESLRN